MTPEEKAKNLLSAPLGCAVIMDMGQTRTWRWSSSRSRWPVSGWRLRQCSSATRAILIAPRVRRWPSMQLSITPTWRMIWSHPPRSPGGGPTSTPAIRFGSRHKCLVAKITLPTLLSQSLLLQNGGECRGHPTTCGPTPTPRQRPRSWETPRLRLWPTRSTRGTTSPPFRWRRGPYNFRRMFASLKSTALRIGMASAKHSPATLLTDGWRRPGTEWPNAGTAYT